MEFKSTKMYTYLRGYATGGNKQQLLQALTFARKKHEGQCRKSGEEYIAHPLTMACHAISIGIDNDNILAAIMLHDVIEDCGVSSDELPVNEEVREAVKLLSFIKKEAETKLEAQKKYYENISKNPVASIAKIIDRCHNVSTMAGVFSASKLEEYIEETKMFVLPLIGETKENFPEYANSLFALKYHLLSVVEAVELTTEMYKKQPAKNDGLHF